MLANDTDPNGFGAGGPTVSQVAGDGANVGNPVAGTSGGSFTIQAEGSFSFDPGADFDDLAAGETRDTSISYTARIARSIIVVVRSANLRFDRGAINDYTTVLSRTMLTPFGTGTVD